MFSVIRSARKKVNVEQNARNKAMLKYFSYSIIIATCAILLCSCASNEPEQRVSDSGGRKFCRSTLRTAKITNHNLQLILASPRREYYAGEEVTLTYKLTNRGFKAIRIYDWLQENDDNLIIYYRPYTNVPARFNPEEWVCVKSKLEADPRCFQLVLNPGNSVLIKRKIDFIKDMPEPKAPVKYLIIGSLDLKSLDIKSDAAVFTIK